MRAADGTGSLGYVHIASAGIIYVNPLAVCSSYSTGCLRNVYIPSIGIIIDEKTPLHDAFHITSRGNIDCACAVVFRIDSLRRACNCAAGLVDRHISSGAGGILGIDAVGPTTCYRAICGDGKNTCPVISGLNSISALACNSSTILGNGYVLAVRHNTLISDINTCHAIPGHRASRCDIDRTGVYAASFVYSINTILTPTDKPSTCLGNCNIAAALICHLKTIGATAACSGILSNVNTAICNI